MPPRRLLIGTPSYDGSLSAYYVTSLVYTIKDLEARGIEVTPIFLSFDALIQRARNDLVALAVEHQFDDLLFIDADIQWDPDWVHKLLKYKVDVVGGTYRKKTDDQELYVIKSHTNPAEVDTRTGLMKVDGLGCGFLRLSRKALLDLWEASPPYTEDSGKKSRMVFDIAIQNGNLISEDILLCKKLKEMGYDIHLDPRMTAGHYGGKLFPGNFVQYYSRLMEAEADLKKATEAPPTNE